ncbi:MAG: UDP-N-acetylglucosamine 1-carboxyvinyltransferase [Firmicutes bacterium]|nr:UDP-N-acetylglucosamine 1-carboxyvinyltransferase [Bacillota bacterium]
MDQILIRGGIPLRGKVRVHGSKNACLPIIASTLLTRESTIIEGVPDLLDVRTMLAVLEGLGASVDYCQDRGLLRINAGDLEQTALPAELVGRMRASFLVLGPLLARKKKVCLPLPGGCAIGIRPVDLHLKGLTAMGANFDIINGCVKGATLGLQGARIYLDYPSVGATENIIMAAVLAKGTTILENAATEPEIVDLANCLNSMGAQIVGAGTARIRIKGVDEVVGTRHVVVPDRIEAGTLLLAGVITGGDVIVEPVLPDHLKSLLAKLTEAGAIVEEAGPFAVRAASGARPMAVDLKTMPYPGFSTDLQPQFMTLLALSEGTSMVVETVFENRFRHVEGLNSMGAQIRVEGRHAVVEGRSYLTGAPVIAPDLRGAAALLLAALAAQGETELFGVSHLWRGYSRLEERLNLLGAHIKQFSGETEGVLKTGS